MNFPSFALLLPILLPWSLQADDLPVITLRTPAAQMKYDKAVITATPGSQVKLIFENLDEMPHNFVLCAPHPDKNDKGMEVAQLAWQMGAAGNEKAWIPESPRILAHTGMVAAHGKEELLLKIPEQPGIYPYVCTFPGHAMAMNGELRVLVEGSKFQQLNYQLFLGDWQTLPDFSTLPVHRKGALPDGKISIQLEGMTEHFGVRYDGVLAVPEDGEYQFFLASDDGARLSVGGRNLITLDGIQPAGPVQMKKVKLKKGPQRVRVDYFESAGQEQLYLAWAGPQFSETALSEWIPPSRLGNDEVKAVTDEFTGLPLVPENGEAIVYRNFIEGVGPRGIAVGYPNGVNLCYDADQMAPALLWQGAFMDAKRHWTGRGSGAQPPLGYNRFKPAPSGPALALLSQPEAPWPAFKTRPDRLRFRGYRLDEKRFPAFKFEMGSVTVTETWKPAGSTASNDLRITRSLYFIAPEPTAHLFVRVAAGNLQPNAGGWSGEGFRLTLDEGTPLLHAGELRVPVVFTGTTATVAVTYHWNP